MNDYTHITQMENILNSHEDVLKKLEAALDFIEAHMDDFKSLAAYYGSDQWFADLSDDERHLIPDTLPRGVLSQDGIDNLMGSYYDTGIRMIELGAQMLKNR